MAEGEKTIGIDLGTTYSAVAVSVIVCQRD
jgi:molecular chaperone DnaK (HSP70)